MLPAATSQCGGAPPLVDVDGGDEHGPTTTCCQNGWIPMITNPFWSVAGMNTPMTLPRMGRLIGGNAAKDQDAVHREVDAASDDHEGHPDGQDRQDGASGAVPQLEAGNSAISAFSSAAGKCPGVKP